MLYVVYKALQLVYNLSSSSIYSSFIGCMHIILVTARVVCRLHLNAKAKSNAAKFGKTELVLTCATTTTTTRSAAIATAAVGGRQNS